MSGPGRMQTMGGGSRGRLAAALLLLVGGAVLGLLGLLAILIDMTVHWTDFDRGSSPLTTVQFVLSMLTGVLMLAAGIGASRAASRGHLTEAVLLVAVALAGVLGYVLVAYTTD